MTSYIYAASFGPDLVKIGFSNNPIRRVSDLGVFRDHRGSLIGAVEGSIGQERKLHKLLAPCRVEREWYSRGAEPVEKFVLSISRYAPPADGLVLKARLKAKGFNVTRLAAVSRVTKGMASKWLRTQIPAERCELISTVTGIPRAELRPDLWNGGVE